MILMDPYRVWSFLIIFPLLCEAFGATTHDPRGHINTTGYAHASGDVFFRRRAAWQVASTMGFLVGKNSGSFMQGLSQEELSALHEILTWGSQVGNNPIL